MTYETLADAVQSLAAPIPDANGSEINESVARETRLPAAPFGKSDAPLLP
jgi:hypothetical protein